MAEKRSVYNEVEYKNACRKQKKKKMPQRVLAQRRLTTDWADRSQGKKKKTGWRLQQWSTLQPDRIIWHCEVKTRFIWTARWADGRTQVCRSCQSGERGEQKTYRKTQQSLCCPVVHSRTNFFVNIHCAAFMLFWWQKKANRQTKKAPQVRAAAEEILIWRTQPR